MFYTSLSGPLFNLQGGGGGWSFCRGQIIYFNLARWRAKNFNFYYMLYIAVIKLNYLIHAESAPVD